VAWRARSCRNGCGMRGPRHGNHAGRSPAVASASAALSEGDDAFS
jgi:hypothetical protein